MCPDTRYFVVRLFTCSSLYPARRILNQTNHKYLPGQVGKFVRIMGLNYKNSLCKSTDVAKLTKGMSRIYPTILIFWNFFTFLILRLLYVRFLIRDTLSLFLPIVSSNQDRPSCKHKSDNANLSHATMMFACNNKKFLRVSIFLFIYNFVFTVNDTFSLVKAIFQILRHLIINQLPLSFHPYAELTCIEGLLHSSHSKKETFKQTTHTAPQPTHG